MSRMAKILLIGAGCSRNYSESTSGINGLSSPLDGNFFQMAKKVILQEGIEPNFRIMIEGIIHDLQRLYGYDPFDVKDWIGTPEADRFLEILDDERLSLEKVMTQLSLEREIFFQTPPFYGYRRGNNAVGLDDSLAALIELIAITISKALEGPRCSKHMKLASSLRSGDVVISFNYDILMDNALRDSGKLTDRGYLVPFQMAFNDQQWIAPEDSPSEVVLLKLHGSMNWLHCSYCGSYFLTRFEKTGAWYVSLHKNCPKCGRPRDYLERVIIPPLPTKDYTTQPMNYLWNEAERHLMSRRREIVIIGYSFPPTDFATEALLRIALPWESQKQTHFIIVNPNKDVHERFRKAFHTSEVEWVESLDDYLTAL
jgi:hypothetical protein